MKIAVASDLHTEWNTFDIASCDAELVFLVGDIGSGTDGVEWTIQQFNKFNNTKMVILIPGNHDFYGCNDVYEQLDTMKKIAEGTKVHILYNEFIDYKTYRILGSTLWSDFKLHGNQTLGMINSIAFKPGSNNSRHSIADFDKIGWKNSGNITAEIMVEENKKAVDFIFDNLNNEMTNVVLTHFPPAAIISYRNSIYNPDDPAAPYFTNTLDNNIGYSDIKFWFYGHNHDSNRYEIAETTLIGWMKGYNKSNDFKLYEMEI